MTIKNYFKTILFNFFYLILIFHAIANFLELKGTKSTTWTEKNAGISYPSFGLDP
jgi:hypothetical protein